ncbi:Uncharacterised protein [Leclercia adecarboxylata]|uniref:Uncharacterized protein n=1 Tax=Leclercia adecarboxylata TaxID=83655 RepID=A0A4U9IUI5_9ENTR|nr:Uncharacterised protein [Leclercia adecarboxylata]
MKKVLLRYTTCVDFTVATAVSPEPHPFSRAVFPAAASLVIHNTTGQAITADNHRRDSTDIQLCYP